MRGALNLGTVRWPGANSTALLGKSSPYQSPQWWGSVLMNMQDASGQLYRRNRYYDPATGRFTQEDPIGLAGGLNLYGFGGGDPVNYSDPYGLCPPSDTNLLDCPGIKQVVEVTTQWGEEATIYWANQSLHGSSRLSRGGSAVMGHFSALWTPDTYEQTAFFLRTAWDLTQKADLEGPRAADLTLLSNGEIRKMERAGVDPHDLKPRREGSKYDLYKAKSNGDAYSQGDIYYMRKPRYGQGPPVATGYNINDF